EKEIREIPSGLQVSQTGYEKFPDFPFMGLDAITIASDRLTVRTLSTTHPLGQPLGLLRSDVGHTLEHMNNGVLKGCRERENPCVSTRNKKARTQGPGLDKKRAL
ncbi:MAG: hypothetical protein ACREQK_00025, partial [Candidatus Binatia bacterium]